MGKATSFKNEFTFDERLGESKNIIVKYPGRVPDKRSNFGILFRMMYLSIKGFFFCFFCSPPIRAHRFFFHFLKVIIERYSRTDLPAMEKRNILLQDSNHYPSLFSRFLVPRDMTIGQFIHILSSRLEVTPGKALFVFVKNTLPQTGKIGHLIHLDIQVKWIQSMNLTRMMMDFCICATAARKHLAKLYLPCP
ncbi:hypothetical protein POTOM_036339 [Populus tomentosa]|uniref:Autophagy-related protein n=1 Tax=Populus tomentosa TaxID=118781 RepID=A0A8X8CEZ2_POPTO|nr:hypothetical protein POTOM_036339 [Populus tomentosa]